MPKTTITITVDTTDAPEVVRRINEVVTQFDELANAQVTETEEIDIEQKPAVEPTVDERDAEIADLKAQLEAANAANAAPPAGEMPPQSAPPAPGEQPPPSEEQPPNA